MAFWLLKTEPDSYSWDDLRRDGKATWDGVSNAMALKNIRAMKKGDLALIYHTGGERSAVGVAQITSAPYADPKEDNEKLVVVDLKPLKALTRPITLDEIKRDPAFAGWDLIRIGRLSVVSVSEAIWNHLQKIASQKPEPT